MRGTTFHFLAALSVLLLFSPFFQNGITWQEIKGVSSLAKDICDVCPSPLFFKTLG